MLLKLFTLDLDPYRVQWPIADLRIPGEYDDLEGVDQVGYGLSAGMMASLFTFCGSGSTSFRFLVNQYAALVRTERAPYHAADIIAPQSPKDRLEIHLSRRAPRANAKFDGALVIVASDAFHPEIVTPVSCRQLETNLVIKGTPWYLIPDQGRDQAVILFMPLDTDVELRRECGIGSELFEIRPRQSLRLFLTRDAKIGLERRSNLLLAA